MNNNEKLFELIQKNVKPCTCCCKSRNCIGIMNFYKEKTDEEWEDFVDFCSLFDFSQNKYDEILRRMK